jgi:hypothetical protein
MRLPLFILFVLMYSHSAICASSQRLEQRTKTDSIGRSSVSTTVLVPKDVKVEDYFEFLDSLVIKYDSLVNYKLTEHILVRLNPSIIDTLANTDYYKMIKKDSFVYDQKKLMVLKKGQSLKIPDSTEASSLLNSFKNTVIDINIPEFKLRIYQDSTLLYLFPIRVGQNQSKYLAMGDRITNLRTIHGLGEIVRHVRNPAYYNPSDGKRFYLTKRDDERITLMPLIPWIETEINGIRNGQMIHPTTNPITLGKAYSNGCIGTKEGDAWFIYYYAPVGTKVHIRYDTKTIDEKGNEILLDDVYGYFK